MTKSRILRKLRNGEHVVAAAVTRVAEPWLTEMLGRIGYDLVWFDLEHRPFSMDRIDALSTACRATGIDLMVRVRKSGYDVPMRALEFGANGIMVPHCRSVAEAQQWVEWVRFPPEGKRGLDGAGADADFGIAPSLEHLKHANQEVFLVVQIEDREAVECVEEIAAVQGVDVLFLGLADLSLSFGVPLAFNDPVIVNAIERVSRAAAAAGKWWGTVTGNKDTAQCMLDRGARLITCGSDHMLLMRGFQSAFQDFQGLDIHDSNL